jgi:hypothetical protein
MATGRYHPAGGAPNNPQFPDEITINEELPKRTEREHHLSNVATQ